MAQADTSAANPAAKTASKKSVAKKTVAKKSVVKKTVSHKHVKKTSAKKTHTVAASARHTSTARHGTAKKISSRSKSRHTESVSFNSNEKLLKKRVMMHGRSGVIYERGARPVVPPVPPVITDGDLAGLNLTRDPLSLASNVALVLDQSTSQVLFEKNSNVSLPIASITKLMTGLVVVEAHQDMDEILEVTDDDIDRIKHSASRLRVGSRLSRANMLHIALMSSENRAASALGRNYPGGLRAFVAAMNAKAKELGMTGTHYVDSNGLSSMNVASASDLAKLVIAAQRYPILCQYSTDTKYVVEPGGRRSLHYANSNRLVANPDWEIGIQKTGYITEAGRCLVMQANIEGRPIVMIFLDSKGKFSRIADARRIRKWLETQQPQNIASAPHSIEG
jgi:D-alanyl-D-alanine endopeptidase (penicillin-binding protein 7)